MISYTLQAHNTMPKHVKTRWLFRWLYFINFLTLTTFIEYIFRDSFQRNSYKGDYTVYVLIVVVIWQ